MSMFCNVVHVLINNYAFQPLSNLPVPCEYDCVFLLIRGSTSPLTCSIPDKTAKKGRKPRYSINTEHVIYELHKQNHGTMPSTPV